MRQPISFLATNRPGETASFYTDVLGLELVEDSPFALVFDDGGHMLRVQKVPEHDPASHTVHGWRVADINRDIRDLMTNGVEFSFFAGLDQSDLGVWTTPTGHKVAWFKDPAGNNLSLTQFTT